MKAYLPWACLMLMGTAFNAVAGEGVDAYRLGQYDKALAPLMQEAKTDPQASYYLGRMALYGYGQQQNTQKAYQYIEAAAVKGYLPAELWIARFSIMQEKNLEKAFSWFKKAADQGHEFAKLYVSAAYLQGYGVKKNPDLARKYFIDAAKMGNVIAQYTLADYFLDSKSQQNKKMGVIWLKKAALKGDKRAMQRLGKLYETGNGVEKDEAIAKEWEAKAGVVPEIKAPKGKVLSKDEQMAAYLSNGMTSDLTKTPLHLRGILGDWQAPKTLSRNTNNTPPQMDAMNRGRLFQPNFALVKPNEIAINEYFDKLAPMLKSKTSLEFVYPRYPINPDIESMLKMDIASKLKNQTIVLIHESNWYPSVRPFQQDDKGQPVHENKRAQYQAYLEQLYSQAVLGDTTAQFELGQLYEYGIGVNQDLKQAIAYYQLAAAQQDLRSEYNLAILYLTNYQDAKNLKTGVNWLMDTAFKGNANAQYVLAHLYDKGLKDAEGQTVLAEDKDQSEAMFFLAASSHNPLAEFQLADQLVGRSVGDMSVIAKNKRIQTIKTLFSSAAKQGVKEAVLPLAFYNAIDANPIKQHEAFEVAKEAAEKQNPEAALLVGMMYDRGIGVEANRDQAIYWYQKATNNPIADFILGTYLVEQGNKDEGREKLNKAQAAGFSWAKLNLAVLNKEAGKPFTHLLEEARTMNNTRAGLLLADYYLATATDPTQMKAASEIYNDFAEKGDQDAQLKLAYLYDTGLGGEQNTHEAFRWYQDAARQGNCVAEYQLGQLYQLGRVEGKPDYKAARALYQKAMTHYNSAAVALGFMEETVFDNYLAAAKAYQLAADRASPTGKFNLGLVYRYGKALKPDDEKAKTLLESASK